MRRLGDPEFTFQSAIDLCLSGIGSVAVVANYQANLPSPAAVEVDYKNRAGSADLFTFPKVIAMKGDDPIVCGNLLRSDFTKLYSSYLVPESKPGRTLYERLLVTANGKCPFCGDIGQVKTLDHYLPKAVYPVFSVLPGNLVPSCRDCNLEKLAAFASSKEEQTLHPYYDDIKYFEERWVSAEVIPDDPPSLRFFVEPPAMWSTSEKKRVERHFQAYGLERKFGIEAGADLPETIQSRRSFLRHHSATEFSSYLRERSATPSLPVNNWRRVMFAALSESAWFCNQTFL